MQTSRGKKSKAKKYVLERTPDLNTRITLEDKVLYLLSEYENPLTNHRELAKIIALILEDLTASPKQEVGKKEQRQ